MMSRNLRLHHSIYFLVYGSKLSAYSTVRKYSKPYYGDVIMSAMASQITSLTIVYSTVYSDADQRKHQSSASLTFVRGIHRGPVNSPHKWPVTRKMFPFGDVIMESKNSLKRPTLLPSVGTDRIRLGFVTTGRKNGLLGAKFVVSTDSGSVSTGPMRMLFASRGSPREFVRTVYCTCGQSNTPKITLFSNRKD